MLKRQGRISHPTQSEPLNIIFEEDESRSSSPTSCYSVTSSLHGSPILGVKARRRHATVSVSDIRLARVLPVEDFNHDLLSSPPRPAPRPPTTSSPPPSPDSFRLTFTDVSFKFPHPPIPTPTSLRSCRYAEYDSSSSLSSSPGSQTEGMPLTPSTSDDESGPSRTYPRPVIQPLVITKHNPRPSSLFDDDCIISPTLLQPFKTPLENLTESAAPLSPLSPTYLPEEFWHESDEASDSEPESDSEWYTREFSKIISLRSPIPPSFPLHTQARPDSMSISSAEIFPSKRRRVSKPLPPTPQSGGFPSGQLDPAFPRRRGSKRRTIPNYPPPPVPTSPSTSQRRPPPRSSIPADCVYDLADAEDGDDTPSTFSFSIYDVYLGDDGPDSPPSSYSQSSYNDPIEEVTFELDYPMMLPLSLPASPFDLEADIAQGLEQLRNSPVDVVQQPITWPAVSTIVQPEIKEPEHTSEEVHEEQQSQQQVIDDIFSSPFSPTFPSHSPTSPYINTNNEEKALKSRWSSSTLGSIREEHERQGASAKLRLYFAGHSPLKSNSKQGSNKKTSMHSPVPSLSLSPRGRKAPPPVVPPSPAFSTATSSSTTTSANNSRSPSKAARRAHHLRGYSDVMVIGYGNNGNNNNHHGMRRRGSVTNSVSDAGSEESTSSTSSSGLRRKPIPVEMFLRSAV